MDMGVKADSAYTCVYENDLGTPGFPQTIKIIFDSEGSPTISAGGYNYKMTDKLTNELLSNKCKNIDFLNICQYGDDYLYSCNSEVTSLPGANNGDYVLTYGMDMSVMGYQLLDSYKSDDTGNKTGSSDYKNLFDNSWAVNIATDGCPSIFGSANDSNSIFGIMHTYIFNPIRWLTPIILLVMTTLDFAKVVFIDDKDGIKKAQGKFVKRAIVAVIIFFAPFLTEILLSLIDGVQVTECLKNIDISGL